MSDPAYKAGIKVLLTRGALAFIVLCIVLFGARKIVGMFVVPMTPDIEVVLSAPEPVVAEPVQAETKAPVPEPVAVKRATAPVAQKKTRPRSNPGPPKTNIVKEASGG